MEGASRHYKEKRIIDDKSPRKSRADEGPPKDSRLQYPM